MIKSNDVVALQELQVEYARSMYSDGDCNEQIKNEYENTVNLLQDIFGPQAACWEVDSELWNFFSDYYKDVNGFRPRMRQMTRTEVQEWIKFHDEHPEVWEE